MTSDRQSAAAGKGVLRDSLCGIRNIDICQIRASRKGTRADGLDILAQVYVRKRAVLEGRLLYFEKQCRQIQRMSFIRERKAADDPG